MFCSAAAENSYINLRLLTWPQYTEQLFLTKTWETVYCGEVKCVKCYQQEDMYSYFQKTSWRKGQLDLQSFAVCSTSLFSSKRLVAIWGVYRIICGYCPSINHMNTVNYKELQLRHLPADCFDPKSHEHFDLGCLLLRAHHVSASDVVLPLFGPVQAHIRSNCPQ